MIKTCPICNKQFEAKTNKVFCSLECSAKNSSIKSSERRSAKRKKVFEQMDSVKTCLVCGKQFEVTQQHRKKKYCSSECCKKAERLYGGKKETDLNYKDQIRFGGNKKQILQRDNFTCQMCGSEHQLIVHHLDESGCLETPNNELDNLITLCRSCHAKLHSLYRAMKR